jgi:hypothetical protein
MSQAKTTTKQTSPRRPSAAKSRGPAPAATKAKAALAGSKKTAAKETAPKEAAPKKTAPAKHRVFAMPLAKLYPLYVQKAERKNRTQAEVDQVIRWLTGYTPAAV